MTPFEELMNICKTAAHDRAACANGYAQLLKAENFGQILNVWRQNWDDVYNSRYADIMAEKIEAGFEKWADEFHAAGFYLNEPIETGTLIICNPKETVEVGGRAEAYLFTPAEVTARDNAQVYCRYEGAVVTLYDHAYGQFKGGTAHVHDFAEAKGVFEDCHTYNAAEVVANGGNVIDHGHRRIAAYMGTRVYSDTTRNIEVSGQARIYPLAEYNNIKE